MRVALLTTALLPLIATTLSLARPVLHELTAADSAELAEGIKIVMYLVGEAVSGIFTS